MMIPTNRTSRNFAVDVIWWIVLVILAMVVLLALATREVNGQQVGSRTFRMDADLVCTWSVAVEDYRAGHLESAESGFHVISDQLTSLPARPPLSDVGLAIWKTLSAQRLGKQTTAIDGWNSVVLPDEMRQWQHVALAAAHLQQANMTHAAEQLAAAREIAPDNPLVHYYIGILRLEQADASGQWNDAEGPIKTRLVSHRLPKIMPNSREMFRLAATMSLERAITLAGNVDPNRPLVPADWTLAADLRPTVGDVLWAMSAENFEGMAHNILGNHHVEKGSGLRAEEHLDAATHLGVDVVFGYRDLSNLYDSQDRPLDAARADLKALKTGPGRIVPLDRFCRHMHEAFRDLLSK